MSTSTNPFEQEGSRSAPIESVHVAPLVETGRCVEERDQNLELDPIPEYYERYTSTMCDMDVVGDAKQIFRSLSTLLDDTEGVDVVPQPDKNQIHALHISRGRACTFTVSIFRCAGDFNDTGKEDNWALVECSRKSGCVVEFNQFFQKVASLWKTEEEQQQCTRRRRGFSRPPSLELKVKEDPNVVDVPYLKSLLAMAESDYYQAQQDGLATLSHISSQKKHQIHLASEGVVGQVVTILKKALKTSDIELTRSGAALLNNLSQEASVSDAITGSLASSIRDCLASLDDLDADDDHFTFMYHQLIRNSLEDLS